MKRITAAVATAAAILAPLAAPAQAAPLTQTDVVFLKLVTAYTSEAWPLGATPEAVASVGRDSCRQLRAGRSVYDVRGEIQASDSFAFSVIGAATETYCPDQRAKFVTFAESY